MKVFIPSLLLATSLISMSQTQTLREKIEARELEGKKKLSKEIKTTFGKGITAVKEAKIVEGAKQVGEKAPDFTLENASGKKVQLSSVLKTGPVILTWYRGGWCPYCNITLAALQEELPAIKKAGATLLALTPELPDKALTTKEKNKLEFEVLTDLNHEVAEKYKLLFKLTPEVEEIYGKFFDLNEFNGKEAGTDTLPLAATYIIDQSGIITWAFLHHDYHMRAEPKDIVNFLNNK